ncbi:hypothetical protein ISO99_08190 [Staphylococcus sp. 18_1_E_LY]|uniref:HTH cro/C1-type domain-containing protein n=1 Tax=Staphylococcus lloydii TaxID=2781774 RepID=A0A7T1F9F7_9STAP|nr:sigma factor-like helix-turn-helix DNA-binding protein [Staphylococcus lloydii]MBF7019886.1 hypothetical protein [Staphylococcus lloydii]MBF7027569.1 hypothetical protein [Staphylococcus lloydii]QPM75257.1 hypothetical protein ISP08_00525 [Staphylococcus lloydii]
MDEVKKHSFYMSKYFNDKVIDNMRELYKQDKNMLNQFRKELHIRGIGFREELQNNFLKGIEYNVYPYISINDNKDRYKSFPFELFGLTQIVVDLKINSDEFFNYVPVNGFDKFIIPERKELFMSKLKEYGFELIYKQEEVIEKRSHNDLDISNYVPNQLFSHFIKYCKYKDYTINEIDEALAEYKNAKGTRKKTWKKIHQYCVEKELIKNDSILKYNFHNKELDELLSSYNKSYLKFMDMYFSEDNLLSKRPYVYGQSVIWDIFENNNVQHDHYLLNFNTKLTELKNHVNYMYIKDMPISDIINFYELSDIFLNETRLVNELGIEFYDKAIIEILLEFIEKLPDFTKIKNEILKSVSERELKVLRNRNKGKTLEEIAKEINVTRERVRQIEVKAKRNLKGSSELSKMINFILFKFRKKSIIQLSQIIKYLSIELEYSFIIAVLLEENSKYLVNDEYMLLISHRLYRNMKNEIEWYVSNGSLVIPLNELEYIYEENMEFATKWLNEFNYKLVNKNFVQSNITIVAALEYVMYLNKDKIFINNDEGYEALKHQVETLFDKEINSNSRALFSRVADAKNVILIDRNAYKYEDFEDIDGEFLVEIKQLVNEELTQGKYADPRVIYKYNSKLMQENNVYSYSHLYSIIKNFYSEDFKVGHQNTLYIYPKDSNNLTAEDILSSYLRGNSPVKIDEVIKDLKWKRNKLEQMIPRLGDVIVNGNQEIVQISGIEEEVQYQALYNLVNNEIKNGYIITADLYMKVAFDDKLSVLINRYNINDLHSFAQFVKSKFMFMHGYSQFLYSKYSEYRNIEDIMVFKLPKITTFKTLRDFVVEKGYSEQRYYKAKEILIEKNKIIPYNNDHFLNLEKFSFPLDVERKILEILKCKFEDKTYINKSQLQDIDIELDDSLMVTPEIIANVAKTNGYHLLEAYYGSTYELPIITVERFNSYAEFVYKIVKEEFKDIYNEENLLLFLKSYELINQNSDQIYFTLKESDYFTFDNVGFFYLNEGGV